MTLVNCSLQSKPHLAVCSQLVSRCPASSHTNIFSFEGKREPSAVCKPQHHLPLPHKPQIKGLHFLNHRGVPGAPRSRCLALYFLLDTKTVQLLQYMVEGKTFPIKYPTYISKKYKNTQSLISACRRCSKNWGEQVKIVTQPQCGALAHKFGQKTPQQGGEMGFCTLKLQQDTPDTQFDTYPSALQIPCYNEAAQLYLEHIWKTEYVPFLKPLVSAQAWQDIETTIPRSTNYPIHLPEWLTCLLMTIC